MGAVKLTLAGFVLLGLALFFISEEAEAISPEWDYDAGNDVFDVAVS